MLRASWGRSGKQQQEQTSPNYTYFFHSDLVRLSGIFRTPILISSQRLLTGSTFLDSSSWKLKRCLCTPSAIDCRPRRSRPTFWKRCARSGEGLPGGLSLFHLGGWWCYDREEDVWVVEDKTSLTTAAGGIAVVVLIAATAWDWGATIGGEKCAQTSSYL